MTEHKHHRLRERALYGCQEREHLICVQHEREGDPRYVGITVADGLDLEEFCAYITLAIRTAAETFDVEEAEVRQCIDGQFAKVRQPQMVEHGKVDL